MNKTYLPYALAVMLALSPAMISACGSSSSTTPAATTTTTTTTTTTPTTETPATTTPTTTACVAGAATSYWGAAGAATAGIVITIRETGGTVLTTTVGADGSFCVTGNPSGGYTTSAASTMANAPGTGSCGATGLALPCHGTGWPKIS